MPFFLKVAARYLTASLAQTGLLVAGVAMGVFVFIFMSALIGGLADYLVNQTLGNIAHVTVEAPVEDPAQLVSADGATVLLARQRPDRQREILRSWAAFLPGIEGMPGVTAVSPQIAGNGFVVRGRRASPVAVTGVEPDRVSAIADIGRRLTAGNTRLDNNSILIGQRLADDLGASVGQIVRLRSDLGTERAMTIQGIFAIGVEALDRRAGFVTLSTARTLFDLPYGISRIEVKLGNLYDADAASRRIAASTGLAATSWTEGNAQLLDGLRAQGNSGDIIKAFALITIVIGVASALLLSTYRRRPEIGIMRAMGATRGFVVIVFVTQGALIGLIGGLLGAGLGYLALSPFPPPEATQPGGLPVDFRQGDYGLAIALTTLGAILASILPARAAARVDPVSVI